jgi:hypothetical protein
MGQDLGCLRKVASAITLPIERSRKGTKVVGPFRQSISFVFEVAKFPLDMLVMLGTIVIIHCVFKPELRRPDRSGSSDGNFPSRIPQDIRGCKAGGP